LIDLEAQLRVAIRDAVNRPSRKPFYWGGLRGYEQLQAIAQVLQSVPPAGLETDYVHQLARQVERALERNRTLAQDVRTAQAWLRRIAAGLRYPPAAYPAGAPVTRAQVQQDLEALSREFRPDFKRCPAQTALYRAWHRLWRDCGPELSPCYDIPGLPPDDLQLEALFGRLRRHQRRISGRKSTRELRDFGHCQVLFWTESEEALLHQLQQVAPAEYQARRQRLAEAEAPHQFLRRLHRDPLRTIRDLVDHHAARRATLTANTDRPPP